MIVVQAGFSLGAGAANRGDAREAARRVRDLAMETDLVREQGVDKHHRQV